MLNCGDVVPGRRRAEDLMKVVLDHDANDVVQ